MRAKSRGLSACSLAVLWVNRLADKLMSFATVDDCRQLIADLSCDTLITLTRVTSSLALVSDGKYRQQAELVIATKNSKHSERYSSKMSGLVSLSSWLNCLPTSDF